MQAIGPVETKLLYTMQWILLYAAEECADDEGGDELGLGDVAEPKAKAMDQYLFSVPTITVSDLNFISNLRSHLTNAIYSSLCICLRPSYTT